MSDKKIVRNFIPENYITIRNDMLYEVSRPGAIIRVTEKESGKQTLGIVTEKYASEASDLVIVTKNCNYIGDLFNRSLLKRMQLYKDRHVIQLIHESEIQLFLDRIKPEIDRELNEAVKKKLLEAVDRININFSNIKQVKNSLIKVGYKKYPKNKIQIFNMFTNGGNQTINLETDKDYNIYNLIGIYKTRANASKKLPSNHFR